MADVTKERIAEAVAKIKEAFSDGFQWGDIQTVVERVTVFAEAFALTGPEKRALALQVAQQVLDETNFPHFPDKLVLPIVGDVGADASS